MKREKRLLNFIGTIIILLCIGGYIGVANAATISFDVTASNVTGTTSKDPYTKKEAKSDSEQKFYVTVTSLTNGPSMTFSSYNSAGEKVSGGLKVSSTEINNTKSKSYSVTALQGAKYYLYATAPQYYANVHAIGRYCP